MKSDATTAATIAIHASGDRPPARATAGTTPSVTVAVAATAEAKAASSEIRFGGGARWMLAADGSAPSPMEAVLASLAACQVLTYQYWAACLGIVLDRCEATVEGRFDPRGFQGDAEATGVGFDAVRVVVRVEGPEATERYGELADHVDRHCPVHDTLSGGVRIERVLDVASPAAP